jgi:hypothetical protein
MAAVSGNSRTLITDGIPERIRGQTVVVFAARGAA